MEIKDILVDYHNNKLSLSEAMSLLSVYSIEYIEKNVAQIDINRNVRKAVPEVVFGIGKKPKEIVSISSKIIEKKGYVLISKIDRLLVNKISRHFKNKGLIVENGYKCTSLLVYDDFKSLPKPRGGQMGIICGGTSDIGIAEEVRLASISMGCTYKVGYDVGIAGIQRLLLSLKGMLSSNIDVFVVVAGMEAALPSVVASLVNVPVVGVPTSIGYGFGGKGIGALTSMLQSCSFGLAVVNIDNGIGGGIYAGLIANKGR